MSNDQTLMKAIIKADYTRRVKTFRALPIEGKDIMIGDSMIAYLNLNHVGFSDWINMGIAGDTTDGVLDRLDAVIRQRPSKVVLSIGTNDLVLTSYTTDEIINNIKRISDILSSYAAVYLLTLTPVNERDPKAVHAYIAGRKNKDIFEINEKLKDHFSRQLIDTCTPLLNQENRLDLAYSKDGIHLNEEGYKVFIKTIQNALV